MEADGCRMPNQLVTPRSAQEFLKAPAAETFPVWTLLYTCISLLTSFCVMGNYRHFSVIICNNRKTLTLSFASYYNAKVRQFQVLGQATGEYLSFST